jgi:polysaccharide biosynthesis protein PslH
MFFMKILYLAHRTPYPPNKGEKIRSYHILSSLAETHEVSLVYWVDEPEDMKHRPVLAEICRGRVVPVALVPLKAKLRGLAALVAGRSFSEGYFFSRKFQCEVNSLLQQERFDSIYVFSSPMAQYVKSFSQIPTAMDFVDLDSEKWGQLAHFKKFPLSWLFLLEKERLARYEIDVCQRVRWSLFVSDAEADLFRAMGGNGKIVTLPNGVDTDLLRLPIVREDKTGKVGWQSGLRPVRLVFAGTMNYFPNIDAACYFVHEIFPLIERHYPNAILDIVGRSPSRAVRKLGRRSGVRVLGEVENVRPHLLHADVSIAPMRIARGVQNKILEAMAMGIPVVTTSQAAAGINVKAGEEVLVGDTPEAFARQVLQLLRDRKLSYQIARRARDRVVQFYDWNRIGRQIENLMAEAFQGRMISNSGR